MTVTNHRVALHMLMRPKLFGPFCHEYFSDSDQAQIRIDAEIMGPTEKGDHHKRDRRFPIPSEGLAEVVGCGT